MEHAKTHVYTRLFLYTGLEINFEESDYSIIEGTPLRVLMQFRPAQNPFTFTVRPVSITSAEDIGLEDFINCASIGEASRATAGINCMTCVFEPYITVCVYS